MNLESDQQEFEQLEFPLEPTPIFRDALILSFEDNTPAERIFELKDKLQELLPEGCRVIVLGGVKQMLYVPGTIR